MSQLGLVERMKRWFGRKNGHLSAAPKRCTLGPAHADSAMDLARSGAALASIAAASRASVEPAAEPAAEAAGYSVTRYPAASAAGSEPLAPRRSTLAAHAPDLDPLDPPWVTSMEELPQKLAESAAEAAAGTRCLEQIGAELEGHRLATRAIAGAVRRLPDLALSHAELTRETNQLLERQALVLESVLDGITAVRSSFKTVEESSRRHLRAIADLETGHRQILFEYQTMFLRAHRRLGWMAFGAILLAAAAIGAAAYVAWTNFPVT